MRKYWWIIGAVLVVVIVVISFILRGSERITTGLQFYLAPDNVLVKVDDSEPIMIAEYGAIIKWQPGDYTLELSADGFESKTIESTVVENEITQIFVNLTPVTDEARLIMSDIEMQLRGERASGVENYTEGARLEEQYPFITKLPIYAQFYTIAPCQDGGEMIICVTLFLDNTVQRSNAAEDIRNAGIDESVRVTYRNS